MCSLHNTQGLASVTQHLD